MISFGRTHVGLVRDHNEDSFFADDQAGLFIVADGLGGHLGGEVASSLAIEAILKAKRDLASPDAWVEKANRVVFDAAKRDRALTGMGTTITLAQLDMGRLTLAHVGDSRAYVMTQGRLYQKTRDHTYVEEMIRLNLMSRDQAKHHPRRNIITRAVGAEATVDVDVMHAELSYGDQVLLCSDGLTSHVEDVDIAQALLMPIAVKEKVDRLIQLALDDGGSDNITAILILWEAGDGR